MKKQNKNYSSFQHHAQDAVIDKLLLHLDQQIDSLNKYSVNGPLLLLNSIDMRRVNSSNIVASNLSSKHTNSHRSLEPLVSSRLSHRESILYSRHKHI